MAGITLTAYSYERILTEETNADSDRLLPYEDPTPEGVGDLEQFVGKLRIQKCIMIASEQRIAEVRDEVAKRLGDGQRTTLTVAIAGMLEVRPKLLHLCQCCIMPRRFGPPSSITHALLPKSEHFWGLTRQCVV